MNTRAQGPSDFRFTAFDFDTAKYDSMMDLLETTRGKLRDIPLLRNVRVVRTLTN